MGVIRLVEPAAAKKPHIILMILFDDCGWADAGWHRNYTGPGNVPVPYTDEVQTPNMNALVQEGIDLNRNYVYVAVRCLLPYVWLTVPA